MNGMESAAAFWLWVLVQALGLLSAWLVRVNEGSTGQAASHASFYISLAVVGSVTIITLGMGSGCWLASATTLALMVLMATCDFRSSAEIATS